MRVLKRQNGFRTCQKIKLLINCKIIYGYGVTNSNVRLLAIKKINKNGRPINKLLFFETS